jgi:hypothetical protein
MGAVFSLSSDEGGGEGRGEELGFIGFPLSPLVPRGARERKRKVRSSLDSTAVPPRINAEFSFMGSGE